MNTFTTKVQQYNDTQDLYIEIPHYILQNLSWEEGDELAWSIKGDQIILTKVKDSSSIKEEPTIADYDYYTSESEGKEYKNNKEIAEHFFQDFDEQYEAFLYENSPEARGGWYAIKAEAIKKYAT